MKRSIYARDLQASRYSDKHCPKGADTRIGRQKSPSVYQSPGSPFRSLGRKTAYPEKWTSVPKSLCRGRDADHSTPPAQIRTSAFTHTALTVDAWRQSAHRDKGAERGVWESSGLREDGDEPIALPRVDSDGPRHSATTNERDT